MRAHMTTASTSGKAFSPIFEAVALQFIMFILDSTASEGVPAQPENASADVSAKLRGALCRRRLPRQSVIEQSQHKTVVRRGSVFSYRRETIVTISALCS